SLGGTSTGWSAEFVGGSFIGSDRGPWARRFRGAAFPEGRCFRANGSGGHCLGGTSTGSSGELPEGSVIESDRGPWARRSQRPDVPGGVAVLNGWAGVWGHCLGGTSTGSSAELPGALSSSPIAARGLDVPRGTTVPGVASPGGPPTRGVAHLRYTIRAAPEPRSAARAAVVAAAVPAVAGAFAVGGCGGGLFGFHGIVGGLFLGAAVALGYRLEQFFLRRHALQPATQQLLDRRQLEGVVLAGEADRGALGAGAAGPADTVHVVLRIIRQGVVDHVADAVDVNTTAGDIGGDQYPQLAFAEV